VLGNCFLFIGFASPVPVAGDEKQSVFNSPSWTLASATFSQLLIAAAENLAVSHYAEL